MNNVKAILFDLDGTLVDSVTWHRLAMNRALLEIAGFELDLSRPENEEIVLAPRTEDKLRVLLERGNITAKQFARVPGTKKKHFADVIKEHAHREDSKIDLLDRIGKLGISTACVTNSNAPATFSVLDAVEMSNCFDLILTGSDVTGHKPLSEGYITAMVTLGVFPKECVIIEDSVEGIISARNTGAYVWEVNAPDDTTWENLNRFLMKVGV